MKDIISKLKKIFNETIKDGPDYKGTLKNIKFFAMQFLHKKGTIYDYNNFNISMYRYKYLNHDAILMLFSIPLKPDIENKNVDRRHLNDRIMDVMRYCENTFITLEYRHLEKVEEEKMMYFTCIKIIDYKEN